MITEYILLIIICVLSNAFFAGSEAALTSVNRIRLRHLEESGNRKAIKLNNFIKTEGAFLGTTLVGTNLSIIIGSAFATKLFSQYFGNKGALVSTVVMTTLILIFGEIIPKTIFRQASNAISLNVIGPLKIVFKILYPLIFIVTGITNIILKPFKKHSEITGKPLLTKSDIEKVLGTSLSKDRYGLPKDNLIKRIFMLGRTNIRDIMIPLNQATLIDQKSSIENFKNIANRSRFSRFPVYKDKSHNIVGTINIYDVLFDAGNINQDVLNYIQEPQFINGEEYVDDVLFRFRKMKKPMAVVKDNDGNCIGIVTLEDLLEELVGEIGG